MSFGEGFRDLAANLIPQFGASVTLIRVTEGAYDVATGTSTLTETSETVSAIVEEIDGKTFAGNLIEAEDKQFTIAGDVTKPSMLDKIVFDGKTYSVATTAGYKADGGIKTVFAGSIGAIYIIHGKKQ